MTPSQGYPTGATTDQDDAHTLAASPDPTSAAATTSSATSGPTDLVGLDVLIIGTGLIGASVGLALSGAGTRTWLLDNDRGAESVAVRLGAGTSWPGDRPPGPSARDDDEVARASHRPGSGVPRLRHVVVAVPPSQVADSLAWASRMDLSLTMSDVCSVKASPAAEAETAGADMTRYVGGHPVAGRETSGAGGARADLFLDRPWAVCPGPLSSVTALADATALARACGARVVRVSPGEHDRVLARLSHVPQLVASALAATIDEVTTAELLLVGQGFRDTTRVADSDAALWGGIVSANAAPVAEGLRAVAERLLQVAGALVPAPSPAAADLPRSSGQPGTAPQAAAASFSYDRASAGPATTDEEPVFSEGPPAGGPREAVEALVTAGRVQRGRLPGKPAGRPTSRVTLVLPDAPGALVRVLSVAAAADVNVEDLRLEHSPSREAGVVELLVPVGRAQDLVVALRTQGWSAHRVDE